MGCGGTHGADRRSLMGALLVGLCGLLITRRLTVATDRPRSLVAALIGSGDGWRQEDRR